MRVRGRSEDEGGREVREGGGEGKGEERRGGGGEEGEERRGRRGEGELEMCEGSCQMH